MKLAEAWRLSFTPYRESVYRSIAEEKGRMWWGAFGKRRFDEGTDSDLEYTTKALRIARFDKSIVALVNIIASVIPFIPLVLGSSTSELVVPISLSLAVTFGFTVLYSVQTFSSFVGAESSSLLSTLPLAKEDFSLIMVLSFVRSIDYMVLGSILSQVALVGYLTRALFPSLLMLFASVINAVLATAIALWLSRLFFKNALRGGRSKRGTVFRLVFALMWGALLIGVSFMFSIPWYILATLESALLSLNSIWGFLISIVYPFSAGVTIANLSHSSVTHSLVLTTSVAMAAYAILSIVAGKWVLETVKRTALGSEGRLTRVPTKDFSVKTRNPLLGYINKDLRISSRNPATAFSFALPLLEMLMVFLLVTNFDTLRASTILSATATGGIFALFMPLALLSAEGKGLEYTRTLPLDASRIVISKTSIATAAYVPVPATLLAFAFMKTLVSPLAIMIPFITGLAVAAASIFEIELFLRSAAKGRIGALIRDLQKLIAGAVSILVPMLAYSTLFLLSLNHVISILGMSGVAFTELAFALHVLKRL